MPWSRPWSPIRRASLVALLAVASLAPAALAGGDGTPVVWWTAPSGTSALLEDITAFGTGAVATWVERGSGVEAHFVTIYNDGLSAIEWTALPDESGGRVDACGSPVNQVLVSTYDGPGGKRALHLIASSTGSPATRLIEDAKASFKRADVACYADNRIALAVNRTAGGQTRLILWLFKPDLTDAPDTGWDLGPVDAGVTPSIAAGGGYLHVTWRSGMSIRYKRYKVGAGPSYLLTAKPTMTIESTSGQDAPRIAADGKRVVVAWQRKRDVVVRVSTDKGATFGARHTALSAGSAISGKVGFLNSVDVQGSTIVVGGAVVTDISGTGRVVRSTDNGRSWKTVAGTAIAGAFVFGALGGSTASPRLHIALDHRTIDPDPATIDLGWVDLP